MQPISETDFFQDIQFLQSVTKSIQEGIVILNQEGRIVSFNEQAKKILNLRDEQLLDRSPIENQWHGLTLDGKKVPPEELPVSITLRTGEPQHDVLLGVITGNNPLKWVSVNSRLVTTGDDEVYAFAAFIDVTKLINSNQSLLEEREKLKASEDKFSKSFNYSAIGKAIVSLTGQMKDVNDALCRMLGYDRSELTNLTFQEITHPEDLEKDLALVNQLLNKELETYELEKRYLHKNGTHIWVLLNVALVWQSNGEPHFFVSQMRDITETRKLTQGLEERNVELLKTQASLKRKISQLKDFAGMITHDVRGPAANIKKMLELHETAESEETRNTAYTFLKKVSNELSHNLNELIQVLQIHLEQDLPYTTCDFAAITESVCLQLQDAISLKKARVSTDLQVSTIQYPKVYLQSILYNLISNGLKYTRTDLEPVINISTFLKDGAVYLTVSDNGLGIDMKKYGKSLFQFQKSFHSGYDSKGIGLYLVRNQVEDLGGTITADSEVGKGTIFTIRF